MIFFFLEGEFFKGQLPAEKFAIFIKGFTWDVAGDGVEELVRPGDCQELLPPSRGNVGDVETEDEGQGNKTEECIEVFDYTFKQPGNALIR